MRVLMICPSYPPQEVTCGVGDYTRYLAEEIARQGVAVEVLTSDRYCGRLDGSVRVFPIVSRWGWDSAYRLAWSRTRLRADLIHLQYTPDLYGPGAGFTLFPLLARLRPGGPPTIITYHTLTGRSMYTKLIVPFLLLMAHHGISANEEVSAIIRRRLPGFSRRLTEIPIGASIPVVPGVKREDARSLLDLPQHVPILVHFGLIYPGKGLETLLSALVELRQSLFDLRLVIVGDTRPQDEPYQGMLKALAERLGVASAVTWMGSQTGEEVSRILQACDVFVVPYENGASVRRGSLMAGLAHGLPVVSTYSALSSAYLRNGDNIVLVPPRDASALASCIASLLGRPEDAARYRKAALVLAEQFSWATIARKTRELYVQVLSQ